MPLRMRTLIAILTISLLLPATAEAKIIVKVRSQQKDVTRHSETGRPKPTLTPTARPLTSSTPSPKPAADLEWEDMKLIAVKVARKYDIHPSVLVAMTALESGRGSSYYCRERNNCWGIGAFDSNPDNAFRFASFQEGVEYLAKMLCNPKGRYALACAVRHDPYAMVREIKAAGYASSPTYVEKVTSLKEFSDYVY